MKKHIRISTALGALLLLFLANQKAVMHAAEGPGVGLRAFAEGFTSPIALVPFPDGEGSLLVADQVGIVSVVSKSGVVKGQPFLALIDRMAWRGAERGPFRSAWDFQHATTRGRVCARGVRPETNGETKRPRLCV